MTLRWADRVAETTTDTGTGPYALAGAVTGYQRFSAIPSIGIGDTVYAAMWGVDAANQPNGAWQAGLATYSAANQVTFTSVLSSSNGNAAVNFGAGTKWVIVSPQAANQPSAFALTLLDDGDEAAARRTLGAAPIRTVSGTSDTPTLTDAEGYIRCTSGSAVTLTVPTNASVAYPVNTTIIIEQAGAGTVTLTAAGGVSLNSRGGLLALAGQYAVAQIKKVATNTWTVIGDVA